jgi:hypothetical protein
MILPLLAQAASQHAVLLKITPHADSSPLKLAIIFAISAEHLHCFEQLKN